MMVLCSRLSHTVHVPTSSSSLDFNRATSSTDGGAGLADGGAVVGGARPGGAPGGGRRLPGSPGGEALALEGVVGGEDVGEA